MPRPFRQISERGFKVMKCTESSQQAKSRSLFHDPCVKSRIETPKPPILQKYQHVKFLLGDHARGDQQVPLHSQRRKRENTLTQCQILVWAHAFRCHGADLEDSSRMGSRRTSELTCKRRHGGCRAVAPSVRRHVDPTNLAAETVSSVSEQIETTGGNPH